MIQYSESQKILKNMADQFNFDSSETVTIENCIGRILAQDIFCRENNPSFDNSAMDGFALNLSCLYEQLQSSDEILKKWFPVSSLIAAGDTTSHVSTGPIIEIMTGARIPSKDFNSVIKIEDIDVRVNPSEQKFIRLKKIPSLNENIRRSGEDSAVGDLLLNVGTQLNEHHLLILATQGITDVVVRKKIQCGIISTGKELVDYHTKNLTPGQIRNSTGIYLKQILPAGFSQAKYYGIVSDNENLYTEKIKSALKDHVDVILSTGAVSMGVFDFVKSAILKMGATIHFHKCAIRPGKPILFASFNYEGKIRYFFGIPGNPVSTVVGYNFFIKPFLYYLLRQQEPLSLKAKLTKDVKKPEGFRCFYKAELKSDDGNLKINSLSGQSSFMVSSFKNTNAWVVLPESGTLIKENTEVEAYSL